MKKDIHPKYYEEAVIKCACGNVIKAGSTKPEMAIEICSACHPFYTGKKKLIDATGRVDRFKKRLEKTSAIKEKRAASKKAKTKKTKETAAKSKKKEVKK